ncbi:MAG TPA: DNA-binding domain-containing protein [Ramlibacter sp.]|nr:DNA-binding domain-containing protein [Ramlibacter sp.]
MPSLLECQREMRDALIADGPQLPGAWIRTDGDSLAARLEIYRNTVISAFTRTLSLAFPSVERLVGHAFFEGAAQIFANQQIAATADFHAYGAGFPSFLEGFGPCAGLAYLPDVARLDWAVSRSLHAPEAQPLPLDALMRLDDGEAASLQFRVHPSVTLLTSRFPIDEIWRAVLEQDDTAMRSVDLSSGPVHLLVQRLQDAPKVFRLTAVEWGFAHALVAGTPLGELIATFADADASTLLAQNLAAGRLIAFSTHGAGGASP